MGVYFLAWGFVLQDIFVRECTRIDANVGSVGWRPLSHRALWRGSTAWLKARVGRGPVAIVVRAGPAALILNNRK